MAIQTLANDDHLINMLESIIHYSKDKMIESRESFDKVIEFVSSCKNDIATDDVRELIFHISCNLYPKIAIFMMDNNMCTKETHFTKFDGRTPLQVAIQFERVKLVEYFIENLEYFDELLVIEGDRSLPALYLITNSAPGIKILEHILKSKHCTVQTIENIHDHIHKRNMVAYYVETHDKLFKTLLDSEKCTSKAILVCPTFVFRNGPILKLVLESGKLPHDYFENYLEIFEYSNGPVKVFMDSQYCNEQLVEKFFAIRLERLIISNRHICVTRILAHPKYLHLEKKYDLDGNIKPEYQQQIANSTCEERIVSLQNKLELANMNIQMLNLQIEKSEIEKQLLVMKLNGH